MDTYTKNRLELWLEIEDAKRRLVEQKSFSEVCKTENDEIGDRQAAVIRAFSRFAQSFISGDMPADAFGSWPPRTICPRMLEKGGECSTA
jgi:hypothetical protein